LFLGPAAPWRQSPRAGRWRHRLTRIVGGRFPPCRPPHPPAPAARSALANGHHSHSSTVPSACPGGQRFAVGAKASSWRAHAGPVRQATLAASAAAACRSSMAQVQGVGPRGGQQPAVGAERQRLAMAQLARCASPAAPSGLHRSRSLWWRRASVRDLEMASSRPSRKKHREAGLSGTSTRERSARLHVRHLGEPVGNASRRPSGENWAPATMLVPTVAPASSCRSHVPGPQRCGGRICRCRRGGPIFKPARASVRRRRSGGPHRPRPRPAFPWKLEAANLLPVAMSSTPASPPHVAETWRPSGVMATGTVALPSGRRPARARAPCPVRHRAGRDASAWPGPKMRRVVSKRTCQRAPSGVNAKGSNGPDVALAPRVGVQQLAAVHVPPQHQGACGEQRALSGAKAT